jgi:FkbM family methyltransferase
MAQSSILRPRSAQGKATTPLYGRLRAAYTRGRRSWLELIGREPRLGRDDRRAVEVHGAGNGAWAVLANSLTPDAVVYSFGIGEDATFEQSLIRRYGCTVHAFDPTPKSIAWVAANIRDARFAFHPMALADHDGTLVLYLPKNRLHVSASLRQSSRTSEASFTADCRRLQTVMAANGHAAVDVLKLDIEGAEYPVLADLCRGDGLAAVRQLLVEFHHWMPGFSIDDTRAAAASVRAAGFRVAWQSPGGHEVLFSRAEAAGVGPRARGTRATPW